MKELHLPQLQPTIIYNDNKSAITLTTAFNGNHKRVKHMLPKINFVMEQTELGTAKIIYRDTKQLPPDIATKSLLGPDFIHKRNDLLGMMHVDNKSILKK